MIEVCYWFKQFPFHPMDLAAGPYNPTELTENRLPKWFFNSKNWLMQKISELCESQLNLRVWKPWMVLAGSVKSFSFFLFWVLTGSAIVESSFFNLGPLDRATISSYSSSQSRSLSLSWFWWLLFLHFSLCVFFFFSDCCFCIFLSLCVLPLHSAVFWSTLQMIHDGQLAFQSSTKQLLSTTLFLKCYWALFFI